MRLEGRSRVDRGHSSGKLESPAYHANAGRPLEMYGRLHLPARLVPRHRDVASASELSVATALPCRSVTMSSVVLFQCFLIHATVASVEPGVR